MKRAIVYIATSLIASGLFFSFTGDTDTANYFSAYQEQLNLLKQEQAELIKLIGNNAFSSKAGTIKMQLQKARLALKEADFWLRYLEPVTYKKINGPLPVEWETEVFEKFEAPYRREGAGLTLAGLYLEEGEVNRDSLLSLVHTALNSIRIYEADSITSVLKTPDHFFLCNRLFLLNLATIYTTGFDCPDTRQVIPELKHMMNCVYKIYQEFNASFPEHILPQEYLKLYSEALAFVSTQPQDYDQFDHFSFIKDYVNPLFAINQKCIRQYGVVSKSYVDYCLNNNCNSIFSKRLYNGQNSKGVFMRVQDPLVVAQVEQAGKLLFYDPILSGNNRRSCASCHKPEEYFTENKKATSLQFDEKNSLPRNSPSLINAQFNHLIMLDGKHISLQDQAKAVITSSMELSCQESELINKIMSCRDYNKTFKRLLKYTPQEKEVNMRHISSAITLYYSKFGQFYSFFDRAMNGEGNATEGVVKGFNIFMGKAQCGTCHFAPQFNGVKPPYVGSEFEVLGTPADTAFSKLSGDMGRYVVNPAPEMAGAFRTPGIRNAEKTAPYMHNGVFKSLRQVIDFYDAGGGAGRGLAVRNQTLSSDSLHLSRQEKEYLIEFIKSLNEDVIFDKLPERLPVSKNKNLNSRKASGEY